MELLQIIILGIVQGIGEFLPISSSGHLIVFRDVFGVGKFLEGEIASAFDIALHLGTLLALIGVFYKDFFNMVKDGFTKGIKTTDGKVMWYVIASSVPAALVGVLFEDFIDNFLHKQYLLIAIALAVIGIIIYLVDKNSKQEKSLKELTLKDALIIGIFQTFALIPGFSRSGTTIATARFLKVNRETAAKFSFFMSAPIITGAVMLKLIKPSTWELILSNKLIFGVGVLTSFIIGLLCIKFLLRYIKNNDFKIFMIYRIILSIIILLFLAKVI